MNMLYDSLANRVKQRVWGGGLTAELQGKKI